MKKLIFVLAIVLCWLSSEACTSAIVSGKLTANGRPLLWKHRDTNDQNNRIARIKAHDGLLEFVALFDARDARDTAAWMGFNERGFAIMNTASYNLNKDNVKEKDMDKEGVLMRYALERCVMVDDFERLLHALPKPLGVEANFGVIDAQGNGAYFETGNYSYVKFDLKNAPDGILVRTNYSHSGREDEGYGYIREKNAKTLADNFKISEGYVNSNLQIMQRVRELAVSGANGTNSKEDLKNMATEVNELLKEMIQNANAVGPEGKSLFAGTRGNTLAFDVLLGNVPGANEPLIKEVKYQGNISLNSVEVDENQYMQVDNSGNRIFWAEPQRVMGKRDLTGWTCRADSVMNVDGVEIRVNRGDGQGQDRPHYERP